MMPPSLVRLVVAVAVVATASCSLVVDVGELAQDGANADDGGGDVPSPDAADGEADGDADAGADDAADAGADADADDTDAETEDDGVSDDATDASEVFGRCSDVWCPDYCASYGFANGRCLESGDACYCDGGTSETTCSGPFVGSDDVPTLPGAERWVAYNIHVQASSSCTVSTCAEFTGDTYLMISSAWSGENDNECGLGSSLTFSTGSLDNPLTVWIRCVGGPCSWSITVNCTPECLP
jgi:hypothetical protein